MTSSEGTSQLCEGFKTKIPHEHNKNKEAHQIDFRGDQKHFKVTLPNQWVSNSFSIVPRPPMDSNLGLENYKRIPLTLTKAKNPGLHKGYQDHCTQHEYFSTINHRKMALHSLLIDIMDQLGVKP